MGKIVQTAGRDSLGEFAPEFAHFMQDGQRPGLYLTWPRKSGLKFK